MLTSLRDTAQAVSQAPNLNEAMNVLVKRACQDLQADRCSGYLHDPKTEEFVLVTSTDEAHLLPGKWRCKNEGQLIAQLRNSNQPINISDTKNIDNHTPIDPRPEATAYRSFLGFKLSHRGRLLGACTLERQTPGKFSEIDETYLITLAAQISSSIGYALDTRNSNQNLQLFHHHNYVLKLQGVSSSSGVAIGEAAVIYPKASFEHIPDKPAVDIAEEIELFREAVQSVAADICSMRQTLSKSLSSDELAVFDAYLQILEGKSFNNSVIQRIKSGQWIQSALKKVILNYCQSFAQMSDPYLKERADDIKDLGHRLLSYVQTQNTDTQRYPSKTILVAQQITPSMIAEVPQGRLKAIVSGHGSTTSHAAILASALNIPVIMGIERLPLSQLEGQTVIVDAHESTVLVEPSIKVLDTYTDLAREEEHLSETFRKTINLPAQTCDQAFTTKLCANTALIADIDRAIEANADGIGLFRSEIHFINHDGFPSEEEQRVVYSQHLRAFADQTVTMRTLDVGGDKILPYFAIEEDNPFLGWRGTRMMLDHPEILSIQYRALLKANIGINNLRILLPMITTIDEIKQAKMLLNQCYHALKPAHPELEMPEVGVMIEVPAAVRLIRSILDWVDFVSIGTNDLTQYMLAVDRTNNRVKSLYDPYHPAVLQALRYVAKTGNQHKKEVSICGELAADPLATALLIGMGFQSLSMNASQIPRIRYLIRQLSYKDCLETMNAARAMDNPKKIREYLKAQLCNAGMQQLIRA